MNAGIDLGNTRGKIAFFDNNELLEVFIGLEIEDLKIKLKENSPEHLIICSVTRSPISLSEDFAFFENKIILNSETPIPIVNAYGSPNTLGYDRLAAAVGANALFPNENCLIVDMGTAIKYDLITIDGKFLGGMIGPGKAMRFKALHNFTQKLPLVDSDTIPDLVGVDTVSCISSGVINGMIAEINGIIENYSKMYNPKIIICGGDASFFESQIKYPTFAAQNLVLEGLNRILIYNVKNF